MSVALDIFTHVRAMLLKKIKYLPGFFSYSIRLEEVKNQNLVVGY